VDSVNAGVPHLEEPGLPEVLETAVKSGKLRAALKPASSKIFMIAVPTPVDHETHRPDMSLVRAAATAIAAVVEADDLVILQSTSPVGATEDHVKAVIETVRPELADKVEYVYCPERAIPGKTMHEMIHNDRAVGGLTPEATERGIAFYSALVKGELLRSDARTAEMVKLVENASRDVQIAFANELSLACADMGLNVWEVIRLANRHPRVNILQPGPGVGGHCIAVDPWFIIDAAPQATPLMRTARSVNDGKPGKVIEQIEQAAAGLQNPVICLLGLAYKENVDDFRESPSVTVADRLIEAGIGTVIVVEPFMKAGKASNAYTLVSLEEGIAQAEIVVLLTAHDVFRQMDNALLKDKKVIDTRGIFS
jgi:UDP-N-acetyl-D-mannosaminuronic acid dehydrogenase